MESVDIVEVAKEIKKHVKKKHKKSKDKGTEGGADDAEDEDNVSAGDEPEIEDSDEDGGLLEAIATLIFS